MIVNNLPMMHRPCDESQTVGNRVNKSQTLTTIFDEVFVDDKVFLLRDSTSRLIVGPSVKSTQGFFRIDFIRLLLHRR